MFAIAKPPSRTKHHIIMTIETPKTNPPAANSFVNLPVVTDWQDLQAEAVMSSPNFLYQYFSISLLVFQVLEVAYSDRDAA